MRPDLHYINYAGPVLHYQVPRVHWLTKKQQEKQEEGKKKKEEGEEGKGEEEQVLSRLVDVLLIGL